MSTKKPVSPDDEELDMPTPADADAENPNDMADDVDADEEYDVDLAGMADVGEGKFPARLTNLDGNATSSAGNPQYDWVYKLCEHDRTMHNYISKGNASRWKLVEALTAHNIKCEGEAIRFKKSQVFECPIVILELRNDTYQGETRLKIKKVWPADGTTRERYATTPE